MERNAVSPVERIGTHNCAQDIYDSNENIEALMSWDQQNYVH
jgi:hypothetical protein